MFFLAILPFVFGFVFFGFCAYLAAGAAGAVIYAIIIALLALWFVHYVRGDIPRKEK